MAVRTARSIRTRGNASRLGVDRLSRHSVERQSVVDSWRRAHVARLRQAAGGRAIARGARLGSGRVR